MNLLRLFAIAFLASTAAAATPKLGAPLWTEYVTAGRHVSIWTNKAQLEAEAMEPELPRNETHPWALQTRWDITVNVNDAPVGTNFVMIEIGSEPFCGTSSCSESIALFGLSTVQGADVQLRSYKSNATANLVKLLHTKATDRSPLIQFDEMQPDDVTVLYHHYPHNSSFYGVGGGVMSDGGRIEVREIVAQNFVAPQEDFFTPTGKKITNYITPLQYRYADAKNATVF